MNTEAPESAARPVFKYHVNKRPCPISSGFCICQKMNSEYEPLHLGDLGFRAAKTFCELQGREFKKLEYSDVADVVSRLTLITDTWDSFLLHARRCFGDDLPESFGEDDEGRLLFESFMRSEFVRVPIVMKWHTGTSWHVWDTEGGFFATGDYRLPSR